jgi:hypothetical protein
MKINKMILLLLILLICCGWQEIDLSKAWQKGYVDGWCYEQEYCIEPIPPIAPIRRIKDTTYNMMYNRGFVTGLKAYKNE